MNTTEGRWEVSNYLAIATATSVFAQKIYKAMNKVQDLSAAPVITTKRPERPDGQMVGAYVYLYMVEHNNTLRNNDLATRRSDGSLIQQPQVALNLKYHISFYGRESTLEAQRLMGSTIMDLHAEPLITPAEIKACLEAAGPHSYLAQSTLYDQRAAIKIEPIILSLEDVSKMWTTFFQIPHEHSLNYEVSVVLIQGDYNIEKSFPAKVVGSYQDVGGVCEITSVQPAYFQYPVTDQILQLKCESVSSETKVKFVEADVTVSPEIISPTELKVSVPSQVKSGLNDIVLVKEIRSVGSSVKHESQPSRIIVQPVISNIAWTRVSMRADAGETSVVQMNLRPLPLAGQRLIMWLNSVPGAAPKLHYSSSKILMHKVDADVENLQSGNADSVIESMKKHGIDISANSKLSAESEGFWILSDKAAGQFFSIVQSGRDFICYYGFNSEPSKYRAAFEIDGIEPGSYLVRVQVDGLQFAESVLEQEDDPSSPEYGNYTGPEVVIP